MAKGKKQTADDLIRRYAAETGGFEEAVSTPKETPKKVNPVLESLRRNVNRVVMIPLELLTIEENVRQSLDLGSPEFLSLVDSVRENGIRQNIIIDLQEQGASEFKAIVIAGQRRVLAGRKAGIQQVAALILQLPDRGKRLAEGLAENLFREDLHCLDQAEAYAALVAEGWDETKISQTFERRRKTILQFLRLARYPEKAKALIRKHREVFTTYVLFNKFIAKSWKNDDELLEAMKMEVGGKKPAVKNKEVVVPEAGRLLNALQGVRGLKCRISGNSEAGKIVIDYQSKAALEKIISLFENAE